MNKAHMCQYLRKGIEFVAQILVLGAAGSMSIAHSFRELNSKLTDRDEITNTAECRDEAHRCCRN